MKYLIFKFKVIFIPLCYCMLGCQQVHPSIKSKDRLPASEIWCFYLSPGKWIFLCYPGDSIKNLLRHYHWTLTPLSDLSIFGHSVCVGGLRLPKVLKNMIWQCFWSIIHEQVPSDTNPSDMSKLLDEDTQRERRMEQSRSCAQGSFGMMAEKRKPT